MSGPEPVTPSKDVILDPRSEPNLARTIRRIRRHIYWARTQGLRRLVEEDELDPVARLSLAVRRRRWRRAHPIGPGTSVPVYLVGLQRSGTNMLARALASSLEFDVHNENDGRVFDRFLLRSDEVVQATVATSRSRFVLFKPLCDSHRVDDLLDHVGVAGTGRAIWMSRSVDARLRSAVGKFGDVNRQVLAAIADGTGMDAWQAQGISAVNLDLVRSFDFERMSPESAAALFWYIRNSLFFDLGLDRRVDVTVVSGALLVDQPEHYMRALCRFLGLDFRPDMIAGVAPRGTLGARAVEIDPVVRARCQDLQTRLRLAAERAATGAP
jgi:hypothetical protein